MPEEKEIVFTLEEARALLPMLRQHLEILRKLKTAMEQKAKTVSSLAAHSSQDSGSALGTKYFSEFMEFQSQLMKTAHTGCLLRDLDRGIFDFPHFRGPDKVFLCWISDEEDISWWHDVDTGLSGRQRL